MWRVVYAVQNLHRDAKSTRLTYLNLCLNAFKKEFLLI